MGDVQRLADTPEGMCAASAAASPRLPSAGVATRPGSTPLTVMPSPASSSAAARMKPLTPALLAA